MDNEMSAFLAGQNTTDRNYCNDGMFGNGGWFIWIILIFAIFMGNGFGGWGNNSGLQGALTRGEMADGFNTAEILRNQNAIMRDQFGVQRDVLENRYANQLAAANLDKSIMENRFTNQQGFCGTQKEILESRFATQLGFQQAQAQQSECCCDLKTAIHAEGEATRALINANTMQELRDNLQAAQLQLGNLSQTNTLLSAINKTPVPAYLTCSPYQTGYNPYAQNTQCTGCQAGYTM